MKTPVITDKTREKPIPDHVQGLRWKIDNVHSLAFNSYGGIDLCHKERHGVQGRTSIEDARKYAAALIAMLAALDGAEAPVQVEVVNWGLENAIHGAEEAARNLDVARTRLETVLTRAKK